VEIAIGASLDSTSDRESPEYGTADKSDDWPWISTTEGKPTAGVVLEESADNPVPEASN
jgi:hypothetical protein